MISYFRVQYDQAAGIVYLYIRTDVMLRGKDEFIQVIKKMTGTCEVCAKDRHQASSLLASEAGDNTDTWDYRRVSVNRGTNILGNRTTKLGAILGH